MPKVRAIARISPPSHRAREAAVRKISIRFTNETNVTVIFFLNTGAGLTTSLGPAASKTFSIAVAPGAAPKVAIKQLCGTIASFTLGECGDYVFRLHNGSIVNTCAA